jgi:hypothetical protein
MNSRRKLHTLVHISLLEKWTIIMVDIAGSLMKTVQVKNKLQNPCNLLSMKPASQCQIFLGGKQNFGEPASNSLVQPESCFQLRILFSSMSN